MAHATGNGTGDDIIKCPKPMIENKFADILRGYGLKENIINKILRNDVTFSDVAALDDQDLELMGISEPVIRAQMLKDFSKTRHQAKHLQRFKRQLDVNQYRETVYRNTAKHVHAIDCTMQNLCLNLEKMPFADNHLHEGVYVTELVLMALEEMQKTLDTISVPKKAGFKEKLINAVCDWKTLTVIGGVVVIVAIKWNTK